MSGLDITKQILRIIQLWRQESVSSLPQEINPNELIKILEYLEKEAEKTFEEVDTELNREILESELQLIKSIVEDLLWLRAQKIFISALIGLPPENITHTEYKLYQKLRKIIEHFSRLYKRVKEVKFSLDMLEFKRKVERKESSKELYLLDDDIKDFISLDGFVYRGLKKGCIISIGRESIKHLKDKEKIKKLEIQPST